MKRLRKWDNLVRRRAQIIGHTMRHLGIDEKNISESEVGNKRERKFNFDESSRVIHKE